MVMAGVARIAGLILPLLSLITTATCGFNENFKAELICGPSEMVVYISSLQGQFTGTVYTEGSFQEDQCQMYVDNSAKFIFRVPYEGCSTEEEGNMYSNVVVVQRHQHILTHQDAAFLIKCDQDNTQQGEIVVTETVQMMVHDNDKRFGGNPDGYESNLKKQFNDKKVHTIYNEKDTITYVKTKKNTTYALSMKQ